MNGIGYHTDHASERLVSDVAHFLLAGSRREFDHVLGQFGFSSQSKRLALEDLIVVPGSVDERFSVSVENLTILKVVVDTFNILVVSKYSNVEESRSRAGRSSPVYVRHRT